MSRYDILERSFEDDQDAVGTPNDGEEDDEEADINLNLSQSTNNDDESNDPKEKIKWTFEADFDSETNMNLFLKSQNNRTRVTQTNKGYNCICDELDSHDMTVRYRKCTSKICCSFDVESVCSFRYKTLSCTRNKMFKVFSSAKHLAETNNSDKKDVQYGMITPIKDIIKSEILSKDSGPVRIHSNLVFQKTKIQEQLNLENLIIPTLSQIQNFKAAFKKEIGNNNKIKHVIEFIKNHQFDYNVKEDEMFFVGLSSDLNDEPIVSNGSDENHCRLLVTTKKMLKFLDEGLDQLPSIFHIDSTYKITKNGFPLVVFGRSDVNRQFHKIAFMITSHEKEIDFIFFYESLCQISKKLNIRFKPKYIVQDGADSMKNAAKTVFGERVQILMCYFHIKHNIKTRYVTEKLITRDKIPEIFKETDQMHEAANETEFCTLARKALAKWRRNNLKAFADHFEKEWIEGPFSNWQIYQTPPGYSSSNSIIESHNRTIKVSFTLKKKLTILKSLEMLEQKCKYYCYLDLKLNNEPKVKPFMLQAAKEISDKNCKKLRENVYQLTLSRSKYIVNTDDRSCVCAQYIDKGVCYHLLFMAHKFGFQIGDYKPDGQFVTLKKRGRPRLATKALRKD